MYFFLNDYNDIARPEIIEALVKAKDEYNVGYGFDNHSENARNLIKKALKNENIDIHFVPGGTPANVLGVACGMKQENSVIAATSGHIQDHEAGSIEATGIKIETIKTPTGKLTRKLLEEKLANFNSELVTVPKKVYISNTTELGEVYTKKELEDIYNFCKENNLYLFIDGARLAAALASEKCDYQISDLSKLCDIFYLGGTKNGLMLGEALVIVNDELKKNFINLQKQKGYLLAKSFVPGIMFETVFKKENGYVDGATNAYKMAKKLAQGFVDKEYELAYPFESNQVFVKLSDSEIDKFKDFAAFELMGDMDGKKIARFVTTYRTSIEEVDGFLSKI